MSEKKGFFSFFKSGQSDFAIEDEKQRDYARSQSADEGQAVMAESDEEGEFAGAVITEEIRDYCLKCLRELLQLTEFYGKPVVRYCEGNRLEIEIEDSEEPGRIIGRDGANLAALQTLLRAFLFQRFHSPFQIVLDANQYRRRREEAVRQQARRAAKRALQENITVDLEPMNSLDRRVVHMMFKNHPNIRTFSVGEGASRHVVIEKRHGSILDPV